MTAKVPFLLKANLREYQQVGLEWLAALYEKQLNGILADEMARCCVLLHACCAFFSLGATPAPPEHVT